MKKASVIANVASPYTQEVKDALEHTFTQLLADAVVQLGPLDEDGQRQNALAFMIKLGAFYLLENGASTHAVADGLAQGFGSTIALLAQKPENLSAGFEVMTQLAREVAEAEVQLFQLTPDSTVQ